MTKQSPDIDQALEIAREALAAPVPDGLVDRVIHAALAAPRDNRGVAWWRTAFPIAWPAALCLNAAALIVWLVTRASPTSPPASDPIDRMVSDQTTAELARALHIEESP